MAKRIRRFSLSYPVLLISIFPLIVFILSIKNNETEIVSTVLSEISSSMNDYPASEFEYSSNCGEKYSGSVYEFPGSQVGCSCTEVTTYRRTQTGRYIVNIGSCTRNQTYNGCTHIPSVPPQNIKKWGQGQFCYKKYDENVSGYLQFLNHSVKENENCEEGYQKCAKLDSMGNYICVLTSEECPINDVILSDYERSDLTDYNVTFYNNKYFYYTSKAPDKLAITKLKAAEEKLCADKSYFYTEFPQYILDYNFYRYGCKNKVDGSLYDDVQIMDTCLKEDLYQDLDLNSWYLPRDEFPLQSLAAKMILYPKHYIGYDKACFIKNNISEESFGAKVIDENNLTIENIRSRNNVAKWFSIIGFFIQLVSCIIASPDQDDKGMTIFFFVILYFFTVIFYLGMGIPTFTNYGEISILKQFPLCSDDYMNMKISSVNNTSITLVNNTFWMVIVINLELVFVILFTLIKIFLQFKEPDYSEQGPQTQSNNELQTQMAEMKSPEDPYYASNIFNSNNNYPITNDTPLNSSDTNDANDEDVNQGNAQINNSTL